MLHRLWLTDEQAKTLAKALRAHISHLHYSAYEVRAEGDHDAEEMFVEEANVLDEILDIITMED